jgi:hypothetical protein
LQLTNVYEVKCKILLLKTRSAPGQDDITPTLLRHLSRKALTHLTTLFNHLLLKGHFPETWKRGKVIPIPKPNKPSTDPTSYRPISFLSTLGKLFERIVADQLTSFANQHNLLPHVQFGFRRKHSTVSQLARITDHITHGYNTHKHTGMVLIDLEKAYDTVWIHGLLYKLITFNLPMYLLYILKAFLEDRSFTVHLNEALSTPKFPPAGLPQGAVLSTILFTLFLSDIPHPLKTSLALYADDTAVLAQSWRTDTIARRLSHASSVLQRYFYRWKLQVNIPKTETILFTRCRPTAPAPLRVNTPKSPGSHTSAILDSY